MKFKDKKLTREDVVDIFKETLISGDSVRNIVREELSEIKEELRKLKENSVVLSYNTDALTEVVSDVVGSSVVEDTKEDKVVEQLQMDFGEKRLPVFDNMAVERLYSDIMLYKAENGNLPKRINGFKLYITPGNIPLYIREDGEGIRLFKTSKNKLVIHGKSKPKYLLRNLGYKGGRVEGWEEIYLDEVLSKLFK